MNRSSLLVRGARLLQHVPQGWLRPVEAPFIRYYGAGNPSPNLVFLLALPRSGSTLTYQALVHGLQPLYLSNLSNLLYGIPWLGGQIARWHCCEYESNFVSNHGFVEGLCGPAEGLRFWSYWTGAVLDETSSVPVSKDLLERRVSYFRTAISAMTTPEMPLVTGYLGHTLIAERLRAWFPKAIFLRLHRDPLSNAASILRSRRASSGGWFSVRPKECTRAKDDDCYAETAAQVYWLNKRLALLRKDYRTIHLNYESLAEDPNAVLEQVIAACNSLGLKLHASKSLPPSFNYRRVFPSDNSDSHRLASELARLEIEHGHL